MTRILSSRSAITSALEAAGIEWSTTMQFTAPGILVEPGDPWVGRDVAGLGPRRVGRWKLTAVAGRADTEGAITALAELVDAVDAAFLTVPGLQLPTWAQPIDVLLGAVPYAATIATVQYLTEEA